MRAKLESGIPKTQSTIRSFPRRIGGRLTYTKYRPNLWYFFLFKNVSFFIELDYQHTAMVYACDNIISQHYRLQIKHLSVPEHVFILVNRDSGLFCQGSVIVEGNDVPLNEFMFLMGDRVESKGLFCIDILQEKRR